MVCKYCQAELEEGSSYCHMCGMSLVEMEEPQEAVEEVAEEATLPEAAAEENAQSEEVTEELPEEAAAAEESKRENLFVKITAIISCAVLLFALAAGIWVAAGGITPRKDALLGNASYSVEDNAAIRGANTVVATVGTAQLTNAQLQMLYWDQIYNFLNEYYSYLSYLGIDYTQPLDSQMTDDGETTWEQYFLQGALETWHQYQSLALEAEEAGFALPAEMQTFLDELPQTMAAAATANGFASADEMAVGDYGPGSTAKVYEDYLRLYYTAVSYFDSLYAKLEATPDEIETYFEEHAAALETNYGVTKESGRLIDVRHILIIPEGGTEDESGKATYSDAEWAACEKKAQALLDQFKSGDATEEAFAQLAAEHTEDPGSKNTGGLYEMVRPGQMVTAFNDWCFDATRQPGDTGLVKTPYGYHIMFFIYGNEGWIRYSTDGVVSEKGADLLESILEAHPMDVNYKKIGLGRVELS